MLRARNQDIALPASVPRFFSAQVDTPDAWMVFRGNWSAPLQRRTVTFHADRCFCALLGRGGAGDPTIEAVGAHLIRNVQLPQPPPAATTTRMALAYA